MLTGPQESSYDLWCIDVNAQVSSWLIHLPLTLYLSLILLSLPYFSSQTLKFSVLYSFFQASFFLQCSICIFLCLLFPIVALFSALSLQNARLLGLYLPRLSMYFYYFYYQLRVPSGSIPVLQSHCNLHLYSYQGWSDRLWKVVWGRGGGGGCFVFEMSHH